ncbi:MAG: cytochrome c oxidase accessory protein CcoG [Lysobacterales bacterium]
MSDHKTIPLAVIDGGEMYASAAKIYPREVSGRFDRLRTAAVFWLLGMFYLFPWLSWHGRQIVLFDLPARKFYIFGLTFWPQDFFYLTMLLMMAAFSLFFFTALAGRLWCGYACPQTVWTEVFLWLERLSCGNRSQQIKLDQSPWNRNKLLRKGAKQLLWISFAAWTGFTFVGFFTPIRQLATNIGSFSLGGWEMFWIGFYGLATYGNAGYLREQVCKYMCPYARFQGAMFDRETLIIAYDEARGEPRGARRKGTPSVLAGASPPTQSPSANALGDCVDCTICVQVCPTGIDIRDGLQYECIACGACIDACDTVMDKVGYPRGLIRYDTLAAMQGKPTRVLRPRVVIYASILTLLIGAFLWSVTHRMPLLVDVLRDRNALFRTLADGSIENVYTLKIVNKDRQPHRYRISVDAPFSVQLILTDNPVAVAAEHTGEVVLTLRSAAGTVKGVVPIQLSVQSVDQPEVVAIEASRYIGPF